jgi:phosphopantothenoylcysteine decarboxylase/phosphopantothenate--cysteine ligase
VVESMTLAGKRILLGITGGIAAYKAAELVRLLVRAGADVRVALTEAGTRFVTPVTLQALSGQPVWSDLWDARVPDSMGHIELSRDRELIVVAPASADFMAKVAHGLADE